MKHTTSQVDRPRKRKGEDLMPRHPLSNVVGNSPSRWQRPRMRPAESSLERCCMAGCALGACERGAHRAPLATAQHGAALCNAAHTPPPRSLCTPPSRSQPASRLALYIPTTLAAARLYVAAAVALRASSVRVCTPPFFPIQARPVPPPRCPGGPSGCWFDGALRSGADHSGRDSPRPVLLVPLHRPRRGWHRSRTTVGLPRRLCHCRRDAQRHRGRHPPRR